MPTATPTRAPGLPRGGWGVPVAESVLAPPGPIPNPVVTQRSAGEYCGGDPTGGEAAAGTPHPRDGGGRRSAEEARRREARWPVGPDETTDGEELRARRHWPRANGQAPDAGWSSGSSFGS